MKTVVLCHALSYALLLTFLPRHLRIVLSHEIENTAKAFAHLGLLHCAEVWEQRGDGIWVGNMTVM